MIKHEVTGYIVIAYGAGIGDPSKTIGIFKNFSDATIAAHKAGDWGGDATVKEYNETILVYETLEEYMPIMKDKIKQAALAKLDDVERSVLGL